MPRKKYSNASATGASAGQKAQNAVVSTDDSINIGQNTSMGSIKPTLNGDHIHIQDPIDIKWPWRISKLQVIYR
jgi:hypothetical protein